LLEGSASALVVELKFSSLPDNIRMGRDYPVEQMLDTLCKNGFAQLLRYRAGQSNRGSHPAHKIRMGRDSNWVTLRRFLAQDPTPSWTFNLSAFPGESRIELTPQ
jgi:hypothetical protein